MILEDGYDVEQEQWSTSHAVRCLNCGNFEDSIILANRTASHVPAPPQGRTGRARQPRATQPAWVL